MKVGRLLPIILLMALLSGCKESDVQITIDQENESSLSINSSVTTSDAFKTEINEYMNQFMGEYMQSDGMIITKQALDGESTEGGEITRYENEAGTVLRYRLIYYGELGQIEMNYYFLKSSLYYTCLEEYYSSPIYLKETDILRRSLEEVLLSDGVCYKYDPISNNFVQSGTWNASYNSLEELNDLFDRMKLQDWRNMSYSI